MRVLHVVATNGRRGAEVFASDLVRWLGGTDVKQNVAVLRPGNGYGVEFEAPTVFLGREDGVGRVSRLDPRRIYSLGRLVSSSRPDVLQAHGGEALKYSVAATVGRGTRIVYRKIGVAERHATYGFGKLAYRRLLSRATRVALVADALRRETVETFRVPAARVVTIPNGVDPERMSQSRTRSATRRILGIPPVVPVLVSLGALTVEKDPLAHLEISSRALRVHPAAIHVFVGDGPLRGEMEAEIRSRGLDGRVLFLGERNDVADVLAVGDLLLLASRSEGMPGVVIEAGMMTVPVAGFAVAGTPEVVLNGTTGLLAPAGDLDALTAHVLALLADVGMRARMGQAARVRCSSEFGIRSIGPRYLSLYEGLLK